MDEGLSGPSARCSSPCTSRGCSTGAGGSSTGAPLPDRPVRHQVGTRRSGPPALCATRWPTGRASSGSRPRGPRRCWAFTAVAVHPDDRYRDLVGKTVRLPLVDRLIPIVADAAVDRELGTGAVKVTPAHDPNDWEIAQRHDLPAVDILSEEAVVNAEGGGFEGLDRYAARREVKAALAGLGLLERVTEAPLGRALLPLPDRGRAAAVAPVVRGHQAAGRQGHGDGPFRADPVRAGPLREDLLRLDGADPRLVRLPPALVGPPHPRLVLPGRARHRGPPGPRRLRRVRGRRAGPGRGRARHLVLERAVAVLDPRLARPDRRPEGLLPDVGAGHRVRHHLLLGGPDADVRLPLPAADPVRGGRHPRDGPRRPGQEDVQVVRERSTRSS